MLYDQVLETLRVYDIHYKMMREVKERAEMDASFLPDVTDVVLTPGVVASILSTLGFSIESVKMLQVARAGKELTNLYVPRVGRDIPALFEGAQQLAPLLNARELKDPTPAEIEEAIEEMNDLIVDIMKKIDDMLCDAKTKPYFAKFLVCVKAINMYSP